MKISNKMKKEMSKPIDMSKMPRPRTGIEDRPTIPCKKVMLSKKDKANTRQNRKQAVRRAYQEY